MIIDYSTDHTLRLPRTVICDPEPELLHEWHDHPPLGYHDEAVPGCLSCEQRWELAVPP